MQIHPAKPLQTDLLFNLRTHDLVNPFLRGTDRPEARGGSIKDENVSVRIYNATGDDLRAWKRDAARERNYLQVCAACLCKYRTATDYGTVYRGWVYRVIRSDRVGRSVVIAFPG